jgi:hypothetical protein
MIKFYEYLDYPEIAPELIEDVDSVLKKPKKSTVVPNSFKYFENRHAGADLLSFLQKKFSADLYAQYQIIHPNIPIHKDIARNFAINYIVLKGGDDATTCFYDEDKNLQCGVSFDLHRWHIIRTDVFHNVCNVNSLRMSISINFKNDHLLAKKVFGY